MCDMRRTDALQSSRLVGHLDLILSHFEEQCSLFEQMREIDPGKWEELGGFDVGILDPKSGELTQNIDILCREVPEIILFTHNPIINPKYAI